TGGASDENTSRRNHDRTPSQGLDIRAAPRYASPTRLTAFDPSRPETFGFRPVTTASRKSRLSDETDGLRPFPAGNLRFPAGDHRIPEVLKLQLEVLQRCTQVSGGILHVKSHLPPPDVLMNFDIGPVVFSNDACPFCPEHFQRVPEVIEP